MGTARAREVLEIARMHPRSANDVPVNAQERKNTTSDCALNLFFCAQLTANDALKHKILLGFEDEIIAKKPGATALFRDSHYFIGEF